MQDWREKNKLKLKQMTKKNVDQVKKKTHSEDIWWEHYKRNVKKLMCLHYFYKLDEEKK